MRSIKLRLEEQKQLLSCCPKRFSFGIPCPPSAWVSGHIWLPRWLVCSSNRRVFACREVILRTLQLRSGRQGTEGCWGAYQRLSGGWECMKEMPEGSLFRVHLLLWVVFLLLLSEIIQVEFSGPVFLVERCWLRIAEEAEVGGRLCIIEVSVELSSARSFRMNDRSFLEVDVVCRCSSVVRSRR